MKKITLLITMLTLICTVGQTFAQETVPKELLLSTLNSVGELKLPNEKVTQLMEEAMKPLTKQDKLLKQITKRP